MSARAFRDRPWFAAVLIVLLMGTSAALQAARDRWLERPVVPERLLYIQSSAAMKRMALSFRALASDIYWIRTVQHYGGDHLSRGTARRYELLHPLLDLTTTLDPHFSIAYRFGAFFLADAYPSGAGRPDLAVALLQKGLRAEPDKWQYAMDIGFVYYWAVGDFKKAGEWYLKSSKMPGAPDWMAPLAATTFAGGDRRASRFLWHQIRSTTESDWIRREAERRLVQLDALDEIERINAALAPRIAHLTDGPLTWDRLIRAGIIRRVPQDPTGVPYELNPWWGEVTVSRDSRLWPLPEGAAGRTAVAR